jgi:hypothetical protein
MECGPGPEEVHRAPHDGFREHAVFNEPRPSRCQAFDRRHRRRGGHRDAIERAHGRADHEVGSDAVFQQSVQHPDFCGTEVSPAAQNERDLATPGCTGFAGTRPHADRIIARRVAPGNRGFSARWLLLYNDERAENPSGPG